MRRHLLHLVWWAPLLAASSPARAEEPAEEVPPSLGVIQNRKYDLLHEVTLLGGGLPVDAFYKGLTVTGGYTFHFNEILAWQVAQFTYSFNIDTELKKNLVKTAVGYGGAAPQFPEVEWFLASHLVLKPLYGKEALFNTRVVHLEAYLLAGPAFVRRSGPEEGFAFGVDSGFGVRLWLNTFASLRFDIMELVYFLEQKPEQVLHLHLGFGFNLRGEE